MNTKFKELVEKKKKDLMSNPTSDNKKEFTKKEGDKNDGNGNR